MIADSFAVFLFIHYKMTPRHTVLVSTGPCRVGVATTQTSVALKMHFFCHRGFSRDVLNSKSHLWFDVKVPPSMILSRLLFLVLLMLHVIIPAFSFFVFQTIDLIVRTMIDSMNAEVCTGSNEIVINS